MKKILLKIQLLLVLGILLTGCAAAERPAADLQPEAVGEQSQSTPDAYLAEKIETGQPDILSETVFQDTLYYLSTASEDAGQLTVGSLDLNAAPGQQEPGSVSATVKLGKSGDGYRIAAAPAGAVHILDTQYTDGKAEDCLFSSVSADGTAALPLSLRELLGGNESAYVSALETDEEGNSYLAVDQTIFIVDPSGAPAGEIFCGGGIFGLCRDSGGKLYAFIGSESGTNTIASVDPKGQAVTGKQELPELGQAGEMIGAGPGEAGKLVLVTAGKVFDYDPSAKTLTERFQWFDLNLMVNEEARAYPLSDGRILLAEGTGAGTAMTMIRKRTADDPAAESSSPDTAQGDPAAESSSPDMARDDPAALPDDATMAAAAERLQEIRDEKGNLVLGVGVYRLEPGVQEAIVNFNKNNPDSRIEIKEYLTGDYMEGINRLNADIVSGSGPDLMILDAEQFPIGLYEEKGLLEDLKPYLLADDRIKSEDYLQNILYINENQGKLYNVPYAFSVNTLVGKAKALGGRTKWNLDEMIAFTDGLAQEEYMFEYPTKSTVMDICLKANSSYVVDWHSESGSGFRRDFFIKMLEYANRFIPDAELDYGAMLDVKAKDGELELFAGGSLDDNQLYGTWFGEPLTGIGYPSESGSGSLAVPRTVIVSSASQAKGTAWEFVCSLLSEPVQDQMDFNPVRRGSLEKLIELATGSTRGQSNWSVEVETKAPNAEEVKTYWEMIDSVEKTVIGWDNEIHQIIMEEAGAYFSGGKTAVEVTDIIENRVGVYVSEAK